MSFIETAHATKEASPQTQTESDSGVLGSLGIDGTLFAAQFINFAIVAIILWFLILKPLTKKMQERADLIDKSIENAKKIDDNLKKNEQQFQKRIDEAKVEANKIIENGTLEATKVADSMKIKAKSEIEMLVDQAKRNIGIEKDEMVAEFKSEAADLIIRSLEKILSEKMTGEKDKKMIEEMVKKIK